MKHPPCTHCRAPLPAPHSRLLGALFVGIAWIVAFAQVFVFGTLTGPVVIFLLPLMVPACISVIGAAHEWAFADWTCDACGKLVEISEAPKPASRRAKAGLVPSPR